MEKNELIMELNELLREGDGVLKSRASNNDSSNLEIYYLVDDGKYTSWRLKILTFLRKYFEKEHDYINLIESLKDNYLGDAEKIYETLKGLVDLVKKDYITFERKSDICEEEKFSLLFNSFHKMVRALRERYDDRETIDVQDEYDVQDILFAILQLFFEDIRKEEWIPSYAGGASRADFLLKQESVVIEVKKTRKGMRDKELGEQLIIDIEKYKVHPDCKKLICFVYDPEGRITNPTGIVNDLENSNKDFFKMYINPQ